MEIITTNRPNKLTKDQIETPYINMWIDEGILYGRYTNDLHLSLEVARFCVEMRIYYAEGHHYPLLVDMRGIRSATPEARMYMATIGATLVTAGALITGSAINRTLGNIFLAIDKPMVPTRLFTDEERAVQWLKRYMAD